MKISRKLKKKQFGHFNRSKILRLVKTLGVKDYESFDMISEVDVCEIEENFTHDFMPHHTVQQPL